MHCGQHMQSLYSLEVLLRGRCAVGGRGGGAIVSAQRVGSVVVEYA